MEKQVEINGVKYQFKEYYETLEAVKGQNTKAVIACPKCHSTEFQISFGDYECIANCKCGNSMTVYSG